MIKVMKFGGTSGSIDALNGTLVHHRREQAKKAVVVSTMSGITNYLITCIRDQWKHSGALIIETNIRQYLRDAVGRFERCSQQLDASLCIWGRLGTLGVGRPGSGGRHLLLGEG